jgi:hypothetical protein
MNAATRHLKRAGPVTAALAALVLALVPAASSQGGPPYADRATDSGSAPDITGVTVERDQTSGQIVFRISGTNLSTSHDLVTMLSIDSDANPLTGDLTSFGSDYWFGVDDDGYEFDHLNGNDWSATPYATVTISGGGSGVLISVNKGELGNTSAFNFSVGTYNGATRERDRAPDDGMFSYSLADGGPPIGAVDLRTTPSAGPKAGRPFVLTPTGLALPPNGASNPSHPAPESYSCTAKLAGRALAGIGVGGCTFRPGMKTRGKALAVLVTVSYEGATKSFPFTWKVS